MGPRRTEAALGAAIFIVAAIGGGAYYERGLRLGGHPFFYQTYFEPAVMVACGKGFLVSQPQPPALRDFLSEKTDRFSCDELPRDLKVGTEGLVSTSMALPDDDASRSPGWCSASAGPASRRCSACSSGRRRSSRTRSADCLSAASPRSPARRRCACRRYSSPICRNLRDYAKAPFTVALVTILVALVVRPWRLRDVLLLSLGYGLVMGIGYGFRTDLLVDIPPFLIAIALFLPGRRVAQPAR